MRVRVPFVCFSVCGVRGCVSTGRWLDLPVLTDPSKLLLALQLGNESSEGVHLGLCIDRSGLLPGKLGLQRVDGSVVLGDELRVGHGGVGSHC